MLCCALKWLAMLVKGHRNVNDASGQVWWNSHAAAEAMGSSLQTFPARISLLAMTPFFRIFSSFVAMSSAYKNAPTRRQRCGRPINGGYMRLLCGYKVLVDARVANLRLAWLWPATYSSFKPAQLRAVPASTSGPTAVVN